MKVCIDCRMWGKPYAGIGRYTKEIVEHLLLSKEWNYTLLCFDNSYNELQDFIKSHSIPGVHLVKCRYSIFSLLAQLELFFKIPKCDVLWVPSINIPLLPTKSEAFVTTIHDVFQLAHPEIYSKTKLMILKVLIGKCARMSDIILTVSDFSKNEIARFYGDSIKTKIKKVYNGFTPVNISQTIHNVNYGEYMLYVGNIKPHKNLKNALLGYQQFLKRSGSKLKFVIIGKKDGFVTADNEIDEIVRRINSTGDYVHFLGNINDEELYSLYNSASLFIQPSLYEGFGIPLIEAMSFNLPIICSDIPVFREICKNQVEYFIPESPESICDAILRNENKHKISYHKWQSWEETTEEIAKYIETLK